MRLGLIGGGFKPFTTGHHSLLATALADSDVVIVYHGLAGRKKGSGYEYTREMSERIFEVIKGAIEREYAGRVHVIVGKPTPIVKVFQAIADVAYGDDVHNILSSVGIDHQDVDEVSVFSSPDDLDKYVKHLGTDKEDRYFGDLWRTGRLHFVGVDPAGVDVSQILDAIRSDYPDHSDEELSDLVQMRGSQFRSLISTRDAAQIGRYLPSFLNDAERGEIVGILLHGLATSENVFRQYVRGILREG